MQLFQLALKFKRILAVMREKVYEAISPLCYT